MTDAAARERPETGGRGRGRPSVIDGERITSTAIELWMRDGYGATGWRELAAATGVSVRSLIRHYGSRSAIAWGGVDAAVDRLQAALAEHRDTPTPEALRLAVVASVADEITMRRVGPAWVALVASEPELIAAAPRAHEPWIARLADEISRRIPDAPRAVCIALAGAYQSVAFAALAEWARGGARDDPARLVDDMLRWLDIHVPVHPTDEG